MNYTVKFTFVGRLQDRKGSLRVSYELVFRLVVGVWIGDERNQIQYLDGTF